MLIQPLAPGPLDVVGDVHGEIGPLWSLLGRLGYDSAGHHPVGRRLVFVGDLTDRGPASVAVAGLVERLCDRGRAQCVLGNHELNILRGERKEGNGWFFGEHDVIGETRSPEAVADDRDREQVLAFFRRLPIALEREDLRVAHACWHDEHIATLRQSTAPVEALVQRFTDRIEEELVEEGLVDRAAREPDVDLTDQRTRPPLHTARATLAIRRQNENPVKVLTSGLETVADEPFWAGGKWRFERRVRWWETYRGPMTVAGHYWRSRQPDHNDGKGPDLFEGVHPLAPLGTAGRVMVIDYSIGHRNRERMLGLPRRAALAALRWPEAELVFSSD